MKKIGLIALFVGVAGVSASLASLNVSAQVDSGIKAATTSEMQDKRVDRTVGSFVDILMWVVGILSVVMIAWSGFRYITSAGDTSKLASAKNTLIYAVVGLIVAIMAYAIVTFVRNQISPAGKSPGSLSSGGSGGDYTKSGVRSR